MRWLEQCRKWVKEYDPVAQYPAPGDGPADINHYRFVRILSEKLPNNAIITSDTGGNVTMMGHCFQSKSGQRIFSSSGNSAMGFSMCGAMGAWFAEPTRPVICLIGDGGFQLNLQELQTIKHYGVKVKIFIINNRILGTTKSYQRVNKKKELACGPDGYSCPDFRKVAAAYDIFYCSYELHAGGYDLIDTALAMDEPVIFDAIQDDFCTYEPRMSRWDCPIEEMHPALPINEFLENMSTPPLTGWEKRR